MAITIIKKLFRLEEQQLICLRGVTVADEYEQDNLEVTVYEESVQTTDGQKEYTSYQEAWKRFGGGGQ